LREVTINEERLMKSTIYEDLFNAKFPIGTFNVENSCKIYKNQEQEKINARK